MNPHDLLKPLRGMYLAQLRERADSVEAFLGHCRAGRASDDERTVMKRQTHKLAGSGTTYGFPLITQTARVLEEALDSGAPVEALLAPSESLLHVCQQVLLSVERGAEESLTGIGDSGAQDSFTPQNTGKSVLIADDDPAIRDLLTYKFRVAGLRVFIASDGVEALAQVESHLPDLAILDRMMPGLDGVQVFKKLLENPKTRAIPVIFLTAMRQERDILEGFRLGVADYVIKPFLPEEVLARGLRVLGLLGERKP